MEQVFAPLVDVILSQAGLVGALLVGAILYLIKKEIVFAQERKEFDRALHERYQELQAILRETLIQQGHVEKQLELLRYAVEHFHGGEKIERTSNR